MQYSEKMMDHCENPRNVGKLDEHDGDCDPLALFAGRYNKFMPDKKDANE